MQAPDPVYRMKTRRTRQVRAGQLPDLGERPLVEAICQSSAYAFGDAAQADDWFASGQPLYSRDRLPNVRTLERVVAELEGAEDAVAVASGMSAIATTLLALLRSGEHVIIGEDAYCETTSLLLMLADHFNVRVARVDLNDPTALDAAIMPDTRLVLAETISNPGLRLLDLPAVAALARRRGVLLAVDNTFATPILCRPLAFGADLVIHSAGKFLAGHSDVTAGVIAGSGALIAQLKRSSHLYGPVLAPMEAWLTTRGIKTLLPRVTWMSQSAGRVALWLADQPAVEEVNYPGLADHAQAVLAARLGAEGGGAVISFRIRGGHEAAAAVIHHLRLIPYVPSVGGVTTIVSFPPQMPPDLIALDSAPPRCEGGMLRLSLGLEDPADIIEDLGNAFVLAGKDAPTLASRNGS